MYFICYQLFGFLILAVNNVCMYSLSPHSVKEVHHSGCFEFQERNLRQSFDKN